MPNLKKGDRIKFLQRVTVGTVYNGSVSLSEGTRAGVIKISGDKYLLLTGPYRLFWECDVFDSSRGDLYRVLNARKGLLLK